MYLLVVLVVAAIVLFVIAFPVRKRTQVDSLLKELNRSDDEEELAQAEDEVRNLDVTATPEDASEQLPDWGPGVPRVKRRPE